MRRLLVPSLTAITIAALAGSPGAQAVAPPDGCSDQTTVSFIENEGFTPGTYTQEGPPAVSVTLGELASRTVSFETTTLGWRVLSVQAEYIYDDGEGGPLGQDELHTYGTGVTSSSFVVDDTGFGSNFVSWGTYVHLELVDCGSGSTTTAAPTTAAPTTAAPTTAAPTTATPTTATPTTATPTTAASTTAASTTAAPAAAPPATTSAPLPATGLDADLARTATLTLLAGTALVLLSRRGTVRRS